MKYLNYKLRNGKFMRQIELHNEENTIFQELFTRRPKLTIDHVILRCNKDNYIALFLPTMSLTGGRL